MNNWQARENSLFETLI